MFNRQAINSLQGFPEFDHTPRRRFLRRRQVATGNLPHPSPAKRFLSLLKLGLTPSKKTSKLGWKPSFAKTTSNCHSSPTARNTTSIVCKKKPFSYAEVVTRFDGISISPTISPSSLSPQSTISITNISGRVKATDAVNRDVRARENFTITSLPLPRTTTSLLSSLTLSPVNTTTPRRCLFRRQPSHSSTTGIFMSPNYLDYSRDVCIQDISRSDISQDTNDDHYDFDLNHHYDFDLDDDLATERHRYLKGKSVHINGVEITAQEQEFTKSFNRIKLDRRPRRTNRRKLKKSSMVSGKKNNISEIED